MSCQNCGAQLEVANQKFCQDCGKKLQEPSRNSELAKKSSVLPKYRETHHLQQKPVRIPDSRPLSKKSLGFGIVSLIIAVTTFNARSSMLIPPFLLPLSGRLILITSIGILNVVGIAFGIFSIVFNVLAKRDEFKNSAMKAGITLGGIGLISNFVLMILAFTLIGIPVA